MGCFSFICKKCNKAILSNSFRGEPVELFLLKDGEVIESMSGEYDSYGRVFNKNMKSIAWKMDWDKVCDLMFDENKGNGIAAIHTRCFDGEIPTTRSEDDPNQGWGEDGELMGNVDETDDWNSQAKPTVKLIGEDGNAFVILGKVKSAMRRAGIDNNTINQYMEEAMSGDYNHLLQTTMKYVNVE